MAVDRRQDWQSKLARFIVERATMPFKWGENDCCLFACDAIRVMYDVDPAAAFRGKYSTGVGGYALIKEATGGGGVPELAAQMAERWDIVEIPRAETGRGDLALVDEGQDLPALGIVDFDGMSVLATSEQGLMRLPLSVAVRFWRLP